jgi:hypothetical protein
MVEIMTEPFEVRYSAGWIGPGPTGFAAEGSALALPDASQQLLAVQVARERQAEASRAAAFEDRQANEAHVARLAGFSATSVADVLARAAAEGAAADRRAERHQQFEQPRAEPATEREITERRLRTSRMSRGRPGRDARVRAITHPEERVERANRAADERQRERSGRWPVLTRSADAGFRIGDGR